MHKPPQLEYKTLGVVPLDVTAQNLGHKNIGGDVLEAAAGRVLEVKTAATGAVVEAHTEGDTGVVEAFVAVTGTRDEVGDVIEHQAFDRTLKVLRPKMCLGHDWNRPIGEPVEIKFLPPGDPGLPPETADGKPWPAEAGALYTKNRYLLGTQDGRDAYEHAKFFEGRTAYSIGYVVKKSRIGVHKGLKTRFIEDLDLFEYGPVLHGAHPLARQKGVKNGKPAAVETKAVRLVRNAEYWGLPLGTPIRPGMKPRGPIARRRERAGKPVDETAGTVEVDQNKPVTIKPTARGPKKRNDGLFEEQIFDLFNQNDDLRTTPLDPFDDEAMQAPDSENINKGDDYNPLDLLVANAVPPSEFEAELNEYDWGTGGARGGDAELNDRAIENFRTAVVDAYREKYNAELVRQLGKGKPEDSFDDDEDGDAPEGGAAADAGGAAPSFEQEKPPRPRKGQTMYSVTAPSGQRFYRQSARDYTHAVLGTDPDGKQGAYSFSGSQQAADRTRAQLARRMPDHDFTTVEVDKDGDGKPDSPIVDPAAPENADAVEASTPDGGAAPEGGAAPAADIPKLTPQARGLLHDAYTNADGTLTTSAHENVAFPMIKAGLLERSGVNGVYRLTDEGKRVREALGEDTEGAAARPDRTTAAMWRTAPLRASERLSGPRRSEYEALSPEGKKTYAQRRAEKDDHATALAAAGGGEVAPDETTEADTGADIQPDTTVDDSGTETGIPAGEAPSEVDTGADIPEDTGTAQEEQPPLYASGLKVGDEFVSPESGDTLTVTKIEPRGDTDVRVTGRSENATEMNVFDNAEVLRRPAPAGDEGVAPADGDAVPEDEQPAELTPEEQAWADDREAAAAALPDEERAEFDALDDQGKRSYATARVSGENHADALEYAQHRSQGAAPAVEEPAAPAEAEQPPAPGEARPTGAAMTPQNLANSLAARPDQDLSGIDTEMLRAADAEFTSRAEQLGKAGQVTRAHQNVKDEIARRDTEGEGVPAEGADAGLPATPEELPDAPEAGAEGADVPSEPAPELGEAPDDASGLALPDDDVTPTGENVETPGQAPSVADEAVRELNPDNSARITAEEIADANEAADASFGITEADDGEFEVDQDVADRQDRVSALIAANESGSLNLATRTDDDLRTTRADVVNELKFQEHLAARTRNAAAPTRAQRGDSGATGSSGDGDGTAAPATPPAPKVRPGLAGALEDYADALDGDDMDAVIRTRARVVSSLRRSRNESDVANALRAAFDTDEQILDPELMRAAAERLRAEARERRNAQARARRTARRLEREKLRSLLGQVDAEMRRRNLAYDPVPGLEEDLDTTAPATPAGPAPGTWNDKPGLFGTGTNSRVQGTGYTAMVSTIGDKVDYVWQVYNGTGTTDDDIVASGKGSAADTETARSAVAHALDAQRVLGRIPADSVLPPLPSADTVAARREAENSGIAAIGARVDDSSVNPLTGVRNPLAPVSGLRPPGTPAFPNVGAMRAYVEANANQIGDKPNPARNIQWDTVKLSPGGGLATGKTLQGDTVLIHAATGLRIPLVANGTSVTLNAGDLMKAATLMESLPDAHGAIVDFSDPDNKTVGHAMLNWKAANGDNLLDATISAIALEKIRAGKWSDQVVRKVRLRPVAGDGTNPTRRAALEDLHRTVGQMINARSGRVPAEHKKTLDLVRGARELASAGAPDAAAVALRRRAVELREMNSRADAASAAKPDSGEARRQASERSDFPMIANLLDDIAAVHLSMHSPTLSPGERAIRVQPGERFAFPEGGDEVRTYRVLTPMRTVSGGGAAKTSYAHVMDETTGDQLEAAIQYSANMAPTLQVYHPDEKMGVYGGTRHSTSLGGNGFVVLDDGENAPGGDDFKTAALADIASIPAEVLNRAATELPETGAETAARRAAAPAGGRAPSRRSPAAPARTAPPARVAPTSAEQKLAEAQSNATGLWMKSPFETRDSAAPGGFASLDEMSAAAKERYDNWQAKPGEDYKIRESLAALIDDPEMTHTNYNLAAGKAKLSPGGHMVIRQDGSIVHTRTGRIVWTNYAAQRWGLESDVEKPSPALAARIADYLERADFGGASIPFESSDADAIVESMQAIKEKTGAHPLATITKAAYADHLALASRPSASDITSLTGLTGEARPEEYVPNPDLLYGLLLGEREAGYNTVGGKRVGSPRFTASELPAVASSREGQTLAKRIAAEYELSRAQAKIAPLDAVRRLNALADELDGRTIESSDGTTFTPSEDLRARAALISDAYDEGKPSPMGKLARNNFVGTIDPEWSKTDISVGQVFSGGWQGSRIATLGTRNVRLAKLKTELNENGAIRIDRSDAGNLRATLGGRTVEDGVNKAKVQALPDGALHISWQESLYDGAAQPTVRLPGGSWKLHEEPKADGSISDADYEAHTAMIEEKMAAAFTDGLATDVSETFGGDGQSWKPERAQLHNEIIDELWQTKGVNVPTDGRALIAGGLGGAGKSTVLKGYAGVDATQYFTVNPDDVKEAMAARGMIPQVEGLSLMESSPLAHEESSYIANMLAARAYANRTNIVWDITMSRESSVRKRIDEMRGAGYEEIDSVFVDIPVETSVERALARHRRGMAKAAAGEGYGGRYVPPALIRANSSDTSSSANRETFETLKPEFSSWVVYDNSVAGREPQKVAGSGTWG